MTIVDDMFNLMMYELDQQEKELDFPINKVHAFTRAGDLHLVDKWFHCSFLKQDWKSFDR